MQVSFADPAASYFAEEQIPQDIMDNASGYADDVEEILGSDVDLTVEATSPTDISGIMYHQNHPDLEHHNNVYGCNP